MDILFFVRNPGGNEFTNFFSFDVLRAQIGHVPNIGGDNDREILGRVRPKVIVPTKHVAAHVAKIEIGLVDVSQPPNQANPTRFFVGVLERGLEGEHMLNGLWLEELVAMVIATIKIG
jgi:hypothetical protein